MADRMANFPGTRTPVDPGKADTYSVGQIRSLITYINSKDASSGLGKASDWPGSLPEGESQHTSRLQIIQQYYGMVGIPEPKGSPPAYPHPDPGEATPGIGPIGLPNFGSILDFLKELFDPKLWLRVGEFILGALLVGVGAARLSDGARDTIIKYAPITKGLVK